MSGEHEEEKHHDNGVTITYSFRIPEAVKEKIRALPGPLKKKMDQELLITIAKTLHQAAFDPADYLGNWTRRSDQ